MFSDEFYPTPRHIVAKMVEPYKRKLANRIILEPSAGKGDILDYVKGDNRYRLPNMYAIEQSQDLQYILQEKGYKVIDSDFLAYNGDYAFDLILMNPPFSNGDEHLLKAWEILEEGDIACLLNAETILNPYTQKRKLLGKLIEDFGNYEVLGDVFARAERRTGVNVALVRLSKTAQEKRFEFRFENKGKEEEFNFDESTIANPIARQDAVKNMLIQYGSLKSSYAEYLKARAKLAFYGQGLFEHNTKGVLGVVDTIQGETSRDRYNSFCDESKMVVWRMLIKKLGIERYMTNAVQKNFDKFTQSQGSLNLTEENIQQLVQMLLENSGSILEKAVIDVFDIFTAYHKENRLHVEGWKTNDKWKVNKKVILPAFLSSAWSSHYSANHYRWSEYADIDRVMCYLTGKRYEDFNELVRGGYSTPQHEKQYKMTSLEQAVKGVKVGDSGLHESEFFYFRCYKKGTLHITFKDDFLWQEFNMRSCSGKQWLPEAEKRAWQERKKQSNPNFLQLA